ncbi:MAG: 3'-5' exonuclease [Glaciecola sp.]|nr:3'-5' exonuclease [Glaciecola sp.]
MSLSKVPNPFFIDIEASSLSSRSYPIEIAWINAKDEQDTFLIQPHNTWTDWDEDAQQIHGITREDIQKNGITIEDACLKLNEALSDQVIYSYNADYDYDWIQTLFKRSNDAFIMPEFVITQLPDSEGKQILAESEKKHRALDDCKALMNY